MTRKVSVFKKLTSSVYTLYVSRAKALKRPCFPTRIMGIYKYLHEAWKQPKHGAPDVWRARMIQFRADPSTLRLEYPTRLDRAHALGYKAKLGIFVVRQRVMRGGHRRNYDGGRHSSNSSVKMNLRKNYQWIAEERVNKQFSNCEVLNSYFVAKDGKHYWYEIILVDRAHPSVTSDPSLSWISKGSNRSRVYRGLTSAGRKVRGLRNRGQGAEKVRPSRASQSDK